jgi:predicted ester cyclase
MSEQSKVAARRFFEEQDRVRGGPTEQVCGEGYTAYLAGFPPMNRAAHVEFSAPFYAAFSDLKHSIEEVLVEGERVAVRFRLTGTHDGDFMGMPASGKVVDAGAIALMTLASGKVIEIRSEFDQFGLMQQIGAL